MPLLQPLTALPCELLSSPSCGSDLLVSVGHSIFLIAWFHASFALLDNELVGTMQGTRQSMKGEKALLRARQYSKKFLRYSSLHLDTESLVLLYAIRK